MFDHRQDHESDSYTRTFLDGLSYIEAIQAIHVRIKEQQASSIDIGLPIDIDQVTITEHIVVQMCAKYGVSKENISNKVQLLVGVEQITTLSSKN